MEKTKEMSRSKPISDTRVGAQFFITFLNVIDVNFGYFVPRYFDLSEIIIIIMRLFSTSKYFRGKWEEMLGFKIRRDVFSFFRSLMPELAYLAHGRVQHINPMLFYCVGENELMTNLRYKVWVHTDGKSLSVRRYPGFVPDSLNYQMKIDLDETTDKLNLSGMLYCTCFDSEECIIARFEYMRESPTLFNQVLLSIKKEGIRAYRFNKYAITGF